MAEHDHNTRRETEATGGQLTRLKWVTALAPALAVFLYETVRHILLDTQLPPA